MGKIGALVCCLTVVGLVAGAIYVAVVYKSKAASTGKSEFYSDDESWGGINAAKGAFHPDRASTSQVTGNVFVRIASDRPAYLRFENIAVDGAPDPIALYLTEAAYPVTLQRMNLLRINQTGSEDGLFLKTGYFNQELPADFPIKLYRGAILWNLAADAMVSNLSFE